MLDGVMMIHHHWCDGGVLLWAWLQIDLLNFMMPASDVAHPTPRVTAELSLTTYLASERYPPLHDEA